MRAIVRGELHALDRPPFAVGQVVGLQPRKIGKDLRQALLVIDIFDRGVKARRIGWTSSERYGQIDDLARD